MLVRLRNHFIRHLKKIVTRLLTVFLVLALGQIPMQSSATSTVLDSGKFRFGPNGESAVTADGFLKQAFYKNSSGNYVKLSYSDLPLNLGFGHGAGNGQSMWTNNDHLNYLGDGVIANSTPSTAGSAVSGGVGTLVITTDYTNLGGGASIQVRHEVTLESNKSFAKIVTKVTNTTVGTTLNNFYVWIGTRDDWVGTSGDPDDPLKTRGNLEGSSFTAISSSTAQSNALKISNGDDTVYFYSPTAGVQSVVRDGRGLPALWKQDPSASPTTLEGDDSYAIAYSAGNLSTNASMSLTWYYIAGEGAEVTSVLEDVAETEAGSGTPSAPPPFRAPRIPKVDAFESGPVIASPGKELVLNGTRLNCTTQARINGTATTAKHSFLPSGLESLSIGVPSTLSPGRYKLEIDTCDGNVVYENLLFVPKPPAVFEAVARNSIERMLVVVQVQSFAIMNRLDYNHVECIVNASAKHLQTAAQQLLGNVCKMATTFVVASKGSTSELRNTHKPENIWVRVTLSNR